MEPQILAIMLSSFSLGVAVTNFVYQVFIQKCLEKNCDDDTNNRNQDTNN